MFTRQKQTLMILLFMAISGISFAVNAQVIKKESTSEFRYDIECLSIGAKGSYLIKVWTYSKKPKVDTSQAKKNAVHGIIFKGFTGTGPGCTQKALVSNPKTEKEKEDFFNTFFADGGKYMKYATVAGDGSITPDDIVKVGKEYKVGIIVAVMKDDLRKDLAAAGIIKDL